MDAVYQISLNEGEESQIRAPPNCFRAEERQGAAPQPGPGRPNDHHRQVHLVIAQRAEMRLLQLRGHGLPRHLKTQHDLLRFRRRK